MLLPFTNFIAKNFKTGLTEIIMSPPSASAMSVKSIVKTFSCFVKSAR